MPRRRSNVRRRARSNPRGVLQVRRDGHGFVKTAEGEFFIPQAKMNGAFDSDYVEVVPLPAQKRKSIQSNDVPKHQQGCPAARVVRVIDRVHDIVVGRYEIADPFGVVVPEDRRIPYDIFTMRSDSPDVPDGALVKVRIIEFPTRKTAAIGMVEEVLGMSGDESVSTELLIARHKLETEFSEEAREQARCACVDQRGAFAEGYVDLRDRFIITIDPADAKDFDDALSVEELSEGRWRLGVHIADVSHYVPWGSSIDLAARRRATSVYLVDRVIPMLPEELSNDICSLAPGQDRRAFTVDIVLDAVSNVLSCDFYPSVICSKRRMTYDEALQVLRDGDGSADDVASLLQRLTVFAKQRAKRRYAAGGMDFESVEAKVRLDAEGYPEEVVLRNKNDATELVEEAMILANEVVAKRLLDAEFPCVYRVHEQPSPDSLEALVPVLQEFSWFKEIKKHRFISGDPYEVQRVLSLSKGRMEADLVASLVLRAMKRADYRTEFQGHYGLASNAYAHFTSPIRRYPDLIVHRMLKAHLTKRPEKFDQEVSAMGWLAEHSSKMERVAEKASRESQETKIIEYLTQLIGQSFKGVVSGVATYGLFVRLENTAEGLLPVSCLGHEAFSLDPVRYRLTGQDTGLVYSLGQRIHVVLTHADPHAKQLEFRLA